jgi:hypothetical protein
VHLENLKIKRIFEIKLGQILNEIIVFSVFLFVLYTVSLLNTSSSAINYNKLFLKIFVQQQDKNETGLDQVLLTKLNYVNFFIIVFFKSK